MCTMLFIMPSCGVNGVRHGSEWGQAWIINLIDNTENKEIGNGMKNLSKLIIHAWPRNKQNKVYNLGEYVLQWQASIVTIMREEQKARVRL